MLWKSLKSNDAEEFTLSGTNWAIYLRFELVFLPKHLVKTMKVPFMHAD